MFMCGAARQPLPTPGSEAKKRPAAVIVAHDPGKATPAGSPPLRKRLRQKSSGTEMVVDDFITINVTTPSNTDLPSSLKVRRGSTISCALESVAQLVGADVESVRITDRNVRLPAQEQGWTRGTPWLEGDATEIVEDRHVLVLPKLKGALNLGPVASR